MRMTVYYSVVIMIHSENMNRSVVYPWVLSRNGWPPHGVTMVLYDNNLLNPVFEPVKIELSMNHDIFIHSIL